MNQMRTHGPLQWDILEEAYSDLLHAATEISQALGIPQNEIYGQIFRHMDTEYTDPGSQATVIHGELRAIYVFFPDSASRELVPGHMQPTLHPYAAIFTRRHRTAIPRLLLVRPTDPTESHEEVPIAPTTWKLARTRATAGGPVQ